MNREFASLFQLGRAERLQLVEDLWDSIVQEEPPPQVSEEKRRELHRRREQFMKNPESGRTWDQVKARVHKTNDQ